jgi:hypothetical protein
MTDISAPNLGAQKSCAHEGYVSAEACLDILFPNGGISIRHFRKFQSQGYIPYLKLGRRTLFNPSEVRFALEKRLKRKVVAIA